MSAACPQYVEEYDVDDDPDVLASKKWIETKSIDPKTGKVVYTRTRRIKSPSQFYGGRVVKKSHAS